MSTPSRIAKKRQRHHKDLCNEVVKRAMNFFAKAYETPPVGPFGPRLEALIQACAELDKFETENP